MGVLNMRNKRSADGLKSGQPVDNSGPVGETANISSDNRTKSGGLFLSISPQSWPGCGAGSPADVLDASELELLLQFFQILEEWDLEAR